ncbi:hypothetical protein JCM6882_004915 [Rhodosporidiobolus microsporus]
MFLGPFPTLLWPALLFALSHGRTSCLLAFISASPSIAFSWTIYALWFSYLLSFAAAPFVAIGHRGVAFGPPLKESEVLKGGGGWRSWQIAACDVAAGTLRAWGARLNAASPWVWVVVDLYTPIFASLFASPGSHASLAGISSLRDSSSCLCFLAFFATIAGLSMLTTPVIHVGGLLLSLAGVAVEGYKQMLVGKALSDLEEAEQNGLQQKTPEERGATVLWATSIRASMLQAVVWIVTLYLPDDLIDSPSDAAPSPLAILALVFLLPSAALTSFHLYTALSTPNAFHFVSSSFAYNVTSAFFIASGAVVGMSDKRDGTVLMPLFADFASVAAA